MEVIYRLGEASAQEVLERLPDPPSYSAVRALLRILEEKGQLRHRQDGPRYLYQPVVSRERASRSALESLLRNFFGGSRERLVAALLDERAGDLSPQELDNLAGLIDEVRKGGR
jgi:predicted transcriptional regulator